MYSMAMPTAPIIMLISLWYRKAYRSFGRFEGGISIFLPRRVSSGSLVAILLPEKGRLATATNALYAFLVQSHRSAEVHMNP